MIDGCPVVQVCLHFPYKSKLGQKDFPLNFDINFPSRRSNVIAHNGLVATSQPLAAQAGLDVLKTGGNALDAAIATAATLCVVEPCSTGIGGDAFALIWSARDQKLYGLNASGPAPAALSADHVRGLGHKSYPLLGGLAVAYLAGIGDIVQRALHMMIGVFLTSLTHKGHMAIGA